MANITSLTMAPNAPTDLLTSFGPYASMAWIFPMLVILSPRFYHTLKNNAFARAYRMAYSLFALHVAVSFAELIKYYSRIWQSSGARPLPDRIDVALCLLQCWTSLYITSRHHLLPRASLEVTRATFQCMSLQRLLALGMALGAGDARWYESSVALLNNFIWARAIIQTKITGFRWKHKYVVGIVGGHLLGMYNGEYPHGIAIYCVLMAGLLQLERYAQKHDNSTVRLVRYLGFASPAEYVEAMKAKAEGRLEVKAQPKAEAVPGVKTEGKAESEVVEKPEGHVSSDLECQVGETKPETADQGQVTV